mmetsp:Transcript_5041/g.15145  ORF Transcript_5041/g.15145 Transcript_5041/m.15145 type:complete len:83 (+) Transcript_5041:716-964(+)
MNSGVPGDALLLKHGRRAGKSLRASAKTRERPSDDEGYGAGVDDATKPLADRRATKPLLKLNPPLHNDVVAIIGAVRYRPKT